MTSGSSRRGSGAGCLVGGYAALIMVEAALRAPNKVVDLTWSAVGVAREAAW
jgi:hypothetical protein